MDGNEVLDVVENVNNQSIEGNLEQNDQELLKAEETPKKEQKEPVSPTSLNSDIHLHGLPNVEVQILQESPHGSDTDDLTNSQDISCTTSAVLVTDVIPISSSGISQAVVFTTPVLSAICPSSDSIESINGNEGTPGLIISKSEPSELIISKTDDSCIEHATSSTAGITNSISTSTAAEGIVVTAHQTSMCYLRQIFDHEQLTSQGQMATLAHGVASHNLPELQQCKWQGCCQHFLTLEDLVRHVNEYHIRTDKHSEFCCYWQGCARNGKGFNARYKMLIHMRTHTGEKPHKCHHENCGKSFSRLENLKIHQRSHTGERPYVCPIDGCDKRYSNSSDRFKHTRTHYERKPYHCRIEGCEKCYTDPSSLRKHLKTHHGQDVNVEEQE